MTVYTINGTASQQLIVSSCNFWCDRNKNYELVEQLMLATLCVKRQAWSQVCCGMRSWKYLYLVLGLLVVARVNKSASDSLLFAKANRLQSTRCYSTNLFTVTPCSYRNIHTSVLAISTIDRMNCSRVSNLDARPPPPAHCPLPHWRQGSWDTSHCQPKSQSN